MQFRWFIFVFIIENARSKKQNKNERALLNTKVHCMEKPADFFGIKKYGTYLTTVF